MTVLQWHIGDVRKVLPTLDAGSVDLVLTSPPFLALRSYLPADHPDKAGEIGSEPTPAEFVDALLDVVEACERVLAPHGSLCFELGDTYSGSGGAGGDYNADGLREGQPAFVGSGKRGGNHRNEKVEMAALGIIGTTSGERSKASPGGWPEAKSLCLIPESFRWALVYGRNPFNGRETPRWRARNVIRWVRPNPPVGALGDKFRPATSEMVVVCKARDRWFDLDAVREPLSAKTQANLRAPNSEARTTARGGVLANDEQPGSIAYGVNPAGGAPPLDWWNIPTKGYPGAHYATWPPALCIRPIKAMCPERVCTTCGEPSRRIVEAERFVTQPQRASQAARSTDPGFGQQGFATYTTLGWTDCGHDTWRSGVVLDPFAGSGTTIDAAHSLGRSAIGIDLDERNLDLAQDRLGMFPLDVTDHRSTVR